MIQLKDYVLKTRNAALGKSYPVMIHILCTKPIGYPKTLAEAIRLYTQHECEVKGTSIIATSSTQE